MLLIRRSMIENFWANTDAAILKCLRDEGAMSPADLADRLGISAGESTSLVCLLAMQGRVKVRLVELDEEEAARRLRVPSRRGRSRSRGPDLAISR